MNTATTVDVEYIGTKSRKDDNVAGTGVTWFGHGDVQAVPMTAWGKLSQHPQVWRRADEKTVTGTIAGVVDQEGCVTPLADLPTDELTQLAADMGLPTDGQSTEQLAEAIAAEPVEAVAAEASPAAEDKAEAKPVAPRTRKARSAE